MSRCFINARPLVASAAGFAFVSLATLLCACSGDAAAPSEQAPDDGGSEQGDGGSEQGDGGSSEEQTVMLKGQVLEPLSDGSFGPYPNGEVCVLDSSPPSCAAVDEMGNVVLGLPANTQTGVSFEEPGFFPVITPVVTGADDIDLVGRGGWLNTASTVAIPNTLIETTLDSIGATIDDAKGQADLLVLSLNGGTITVEGASAEASWYSMGADSFRLDGGGVPAGALLQGFVNIDPGSVTFRAEKDGNPCQWDPILPAGEEPGTVQVPIRAGWWTRLLEVHCD